MTETVDFDKLQAATGPAVDFAHLLVAVRGTGTSAVVTGFSSMDSLFVEARALPNDHSHGSSTLTLLVEQSSDGNSWATAATLSFTGDSTQTSTITSPDDRLRVSWSVAGTAQWNVPTMLIVPPAGGGGGSFSGGTITEPLYIDNADAANAGLKVDAGDANGEIARFRKANGDLVGYIGAISGSFAPGVDKPTLELSKDQLVVNLDPDLGAFFAVSDIDGNTIVDVESTGSVTFQPPPDSTDNPLIIRTESGGGAFDVAANGNASFGFPLRANAGLVIYAPAAPADGDINAGECALWFDDTNGAAKLMLKGKSANGSVVTGSVNLT